MEKKQKKKVKQEDENQSEGIWKFSTPVPFP